MPHSQLGLATGNDSSSSQSAIPKLAFVSSLARFGQLLQLNGKGEAGASISESFCEFQHCLSLAQFALAASSFLPRGLLRFLLTLPLLAACCLADSSAQPAVQWAAEVVDQSPDRQGYAAAALLGEPDVLKYSKNTVRAHPHSIYLSLAIMPSSC